MSRPTARFHAPLEEAGVLPSGETVDAALSAAFGHTRPDADEISALCSDRDGFGLGWVLLQCMRTRLKAGGGERGARGEGPCSLKTLIASKCELHDSRLFFQSLPSSIETLDLGGNRFRSASMESLSSVLAARWLPALLSLDLSDNPLGPFGVRALAKGLSAPLQSLRLARTGAKKEGVEALAGVLEAKKVSSLQTLDLSENEIWAGGCKFLASALCASGAVPSLTNLILKKNNLAHVKPPLPIPFGSGVEEERDYAAICQLLSTDQLRELQELDLSENDLFSEKHPNSVPVSHLVTEGRFPKLRILNLGKNWMGTAEVAAFANALTERAPPLEDLDLASSGDERDAEEGEALELGVQAVAAALSSGRLSHLTRLRLIDRYDVKADAVRSLFRAIEEDKVARLRTLELGYYSANHWDEPYDDAVEVLARAVAAGKIPKIENLLLDVYYGMLSSATVSVPGRALGSGGVSALRKLELKWKCGMDDDSSLLGLAEGLGGGGMPLLEDFDLSVWCDGGTEGVKEIGELLSRGKIPPSLRRVRLELPAHDVLSSLCDGLCVGTCPSPEMRLDLKLHDQFGSLDEDELKGPLSSLAETIRTGRLSYLRKFASEVNIFMYAESTEEVGEALTNPGACLAFLEEIWPQIYDSDNAVAFLRGMQRGRGCLQSVEKIYTGLQRETGGPRVPPLSSLITAGTVPSLKEVRVNLATADLKGVQAFAACLCSPPAASLRQVEVSFGTGSFSPEPEPEGSAKVMMFSVSLASEHLTKLQVLNVKNVRQGMGVLSLCAGLEGGKLSSLRELSLQSVRLQSDARALADALVAEKLPGLRVLKIRLCHLSDEGLKALTDVWMGASPPPLEHLDLSDNRLEAGGAETLAAFLGSKRIPSLFEVILGGNGVGSVAKAMLERGFPKIVSFRTQDYFLE
uniref:Uncharacterized protein n=1 Tax=Chromera velia CCMP2878 TaxID=1169474 RepID=A0A0G4I8K6_9ALVE|eukprot:Cvel_1976.t1-p1 / transcript=Cvel_1976.t1 / gene=Cvel_1976 / organism=Chromera_velia_CCMP2878 / gene_product=Leucine-rich repeat-containing protein LOC400891, putative / transcript_product=Leucine-rich repeat-containing protein LOC400891, putative / location=Cvel_scaffold75:40862-45707(-) / protein_length=918 / sequence_SO=supercontig / SO=protein_coding / is_pseudo=false